MPKNLDAVIRYRVIDRCLRSKAHTFPTAEYIREQCAEAVGVNEISLRTLEKDFSEMRNNESLGYFAPIKFHSYNKGYYYEDPNYSIEKIPLGEEDLMAIELAAQVLEQYKHIDLFAGFKPVVEKLSESLSIRHKVSGKPEAFDFVHFEEKPYVLGGAFLQTILNAIIEHKKIDITYAKFFQDTASHYALDPHVLKEYQGVWYVSGWLESAGEIRTFALDRMKSLEMSAKTFKRRSDFNHEQYFKEVIGITHPNDKKPQKIVIEVKESLIPYLNILPIHSSQIIQPNQRVEVHLIPNKEFFMRILSLGEQVKVIEPQSVISELKIVLEKMSDFYKNF
jgi:predicted DNA-binding transcriptional regulator YafY